MRLVDFSRQEAEAVYDCVKHSHPDGESYYAIEAANNLAEVFGFGVRLVYRSPDNVIEEVRP